MRKLNVRFLFVLLAVLAVCVGGMVLAHHLQSKRIPRSLLREAKRAEDQGDLKRTAVYVERYLEFAPNDAHQWARLGRLLSHEQLAKTYRAKRKAMRVLDRALAHDPKAHDLRRLIVEAAIELDRLKEAEEQLTILDAATRAKEPLTHPGSTAGLWGRYCEATKNVELAVHHYVTAISFSPTTPRYYVRRARLLREQTFPNLPQDKSVAQTQENAKNADAAIADMVKANPSSWQARVARWEYYRDYYRDKVRTIPLLLTQSKLDVAEALKSGEGQPEVRLAAAELAQLVGDLPAATRHLNKALQLHKSDPRIYRAHSGVELQRAKNAKEADEKATAYAKAKSWLRIGIQELRGQARFELLWAYATVLLDGGTAEELSEAEKVIEQIRIAKASPLVIDFLQGRLLFQRQQWATAARLFERSRQTLSANRDLATQIDVMLGACYFQLEEPTLQYKTYQRMATRNPNSPIAHAGMARAARALGRVDDALTHYQKLSELERAPRGVCGERLRLLITWARQGRDPGRWERAQRVLQQAEERLQKIEDKDERARAEVEHAILLAEYHLARGDTAKAKAALDEGQRSHPEHVDVWVARASLAEHQHNAKEALRLLEEASRKLKQPSDQVALRLALARHWVQEANDRTRAELKTLTEGVSDFSGADRQRLLHGLAEAHYRAGSLTQASELWQQLAAAPGHQTNLRLRLVLFDLALQRGDDKEMQEILAVIRRLEGGKGSFSEHAAALRLIWQVRHARVARAQHGGLLDQAEQLLDNVALSRPDWPALPLAKAQIEELRGNPDQSIRQYQLAREKGDRNPLVVRQLVQALRKQQRFEEANRALAELSLDQLVRGKLTRLAANVYLESSKPDDAVQLARLTVSMDSLDYRDHLWLGELLARSGQDLLEAQRRMKRAIELAPDQPETYLSLIRLLKQQKLAPAAQDILTAAQAKLPKGKREHAMAQAYEALENRQAALQQYQRATQSNDKSVALWRDYVRFHLRAGELGKAEPLLRQMLGGKLPLTDDDQQWARTNLALTLSTGRNYGRFQEALQLLGLRLNPQGDVEEQALSFKHDRVKLQSAQARVLATQPEWKMRKAAVERFEDLQRRQTLTIDDHFMLAQLYLAQGNWPKAREQLSYVASATRPNARHMAYYAQHLLSHRELAQGKRILDKIARIHKARPTYETGVVLVELTARWHEARNEPDQALALVRHRLKQPDSKPEEILLLIHALMRQKQFAEALERMEETWQKCEVQVASGLSVALLRTTRADAKQRRDVIARLERAVKEHPKLAVLHVQLGDVHESGGDFEKAEQEYRKAIKIEPANELALNNLAWLLATRSGKGDEALQLINRAIQARGPRGELLDTRALAYLSLNKPEQAIDDLQNAIRENKTGTRCFHLAKAYQSASDRRQVIACLRQAKQLNLKVADLHPVEQKEYGEMLREHGIP